MLSAGIVQQQSDWPTAGHDSGRTGYNPDSSGPQTDADARWIHEFTDDDVDIPAVTSDGLVFVPGADSVRAIDAGTGELIWNVIEPSLGSLTSAPGVVVTTGTSYTHGDWIRAYHAANGTEVWNVSNFEADTSVAYDETFYATRGEYLYAYDLQSGAQEWSVDVNEDVSGSLSAADGTIYVTGRVNNRDSAVYALNASDGSEEWRFEMEGELSMQATAVDGSVYVGAGDETYDPKFYRLNATDGHVEWIFDVNTQPLGAAVADGFVYLAAGNTVHALHEATGEREWRHQLAGNIEYGLDYHGMYAQSPAVADGTVYAVNDRGYLVGLNGTTGTEQWTYRLEGEATSPAIADDRLYVHVIDTEDSSTDYSRVYALEAPPFTFENFALSATTVAPGESLTATVDVTNVDDEPREYDLSLMAEPPLHADWRALDRANGTLAPGESRELTLVGTINATGSWNVSVTRPLVSDPAVEPVAVTVETSVQSTDWPFVGFDSGRTGDNPDTVGPMKHAQEVWNLTYFDADARPVIADGSVFVVRQRSLDYPMGDAYTLAAYNEAAGALEWEFNVSARDRAPAGSATVDGDLVYLFTRPMNFDGADPAVHDNSLLALNRSDGTLEWSRDFTLNKSLPHDQAPVVADGQVYVAGGFPEDTGSNSDARLIAFDADTGATTWSQPMEAAGENELFYYVTAADGMVVATLADEDVDSTTYDDRLVVMNAGGGIVWSTSGLQIVMQEPPVIRDGTVYAIAETQQGDGDPIEVLHAFNLADGTERWSFSPSYRASEATGWRIDSPTVTADGIFVSQRITVPTTTSMIGHLYRLDPASGDVVWNRSTRLLGTTFAVGGLLYAGDAAEDTTYVYNAETGERYTETDSYSRGSGSAQAIANGTMITYLDTTQPDKFRVIREGGIIEYTDLAVDAHEIGAEETVTVTATATNHGAYARDYDVQLDIAPDDTSDRHYVNDITQEGMLAPGESTTISWTVRLDVRGDFVFFLVPVDDGDGNNGDVVRMNLHKFDHAGSQTVHVGDADDGTVFDLGGPRDLAPDATTWAKESFDAGNTGNYTGTAAPTAVGDDVVTWIANHSSAWASGPTVAENTIFAGGDDGGDEALYAFNATDGSLRWAYPTGSDVEITPVYAGGYLYTADSSDRVYQFNATTGERLWTFSAGGDVGGTTVVENVLYVTAEYYRYFDGVETTEDRLYALNATTREILWTFVRPESGSGMSVTPAVENGTVYVSHHSQATYALDAATGQPLWTRSIASAASGLHSPVVEDGVVYVDGTTGGSTDATLYALDAADGTTLWDIPATVDGDTGASPALAHDTLYFTADSAIRAVNATTGNEVWSTTICTAAEYSPVYADGIVYVGTTDSALRAYDADTGELVWRYEGDNEYAFTPAVVDGVLYATGLENADGTYSLLAMTGGTTAAPKPLFNYYGLSVSNAVAAVGEPITVSATVQNQGDAACNYAADLAIDGSVAATATGSLSDGATETVEFTHSFTSVGSYMVSIAGLAPVEVTVTAPSPGIVASPSPVEYGDVIVGETHGTIGVLIKNNGTAPLEVSSRTITGPDADDFGFSYPGPNSTIAPGSSSWVGVWFAPSHVGAHEAAIELATNATTGAFVIPLNGTGVTDPPLVQVTPTAIDFGDVTTGTTASQTVTIENVGGTTLTFDTATLGTAELDAFEIVGGNVTTALAPGATHDVTVAFTPLTATTNTTTLFVSTNDSTNAVVTMPVAGTGVDPVATVTPTATPASPSTPTPPPSTPRNNGGTGGNNGGPTQPAATSKSVSAAGGVSQVAVTNARAGVPVDAALPFDAGAAVAVTRVNVTTNTDRDYRISLTASETPPANATFSLSAGQTPLGYFVVTHSVPDTEIEGVRFTFRISTARLDAAGIDPATVSLARNSNGIHSAVPTRVVDDDGTHVVFEADSPGLSAFAIHGASAEGAPTDTVTPTVTSTPTAATPTATQSTDTDVPTTSTSAPGFGALAVLLAALAAALLAMARRR